MNHHQGDAVSGIPGHYPEYNPSQLPPQYRSGLFLALWISLHHMPHHSHVLSDPGRWFSATALCAPGTA